jgi:hypothetical protein
MSKGLTGVYTVNQSHPRANLETEILLGSLTFFKVKNPRKNNLNNNYLVLHGGVFHLWVCLLLPPN